MRKAYGKYSKPYQKAVLNKVHVVIPLLCLIIGIISGVFQASGIDPERLKAIEDVLIQNLGNKHNFSEVFTGNVLKNGGYMLFIWLTAFIPLGYIAAWLILFVRAMGYGYTAAAMLLVINKTGLTYMVNIYLQSIILLASAYLLCMCGHNFAGLLKNKRVSSNKHQVLAYFVILLIAETSVVLASML